MELWGDKAGRTDAALRRLELPPMVARNESRHGRKHARDDHARASHTLNARERMQSALALRPRASRDTACQGSAHSRTGTPARAIASLTSRTVYVPK